jgi:hypothetical protein
LLDGGAYAYSVTDKSSFWHIHADVAERVTEVPSLSSVPPLAPLSAFPLYIAERQKRLQAEKELEERPNPDDTHQSQTNETPFWHLHRLADCSCDARFRCHWQTSVQLLHVIALDLLPYFRVFGVRSIRKELGTLGLVFRGVGCDV